MTTLERTRDGWNEVLERVGLRPGMRFLDVAAGSGALEFDDDTFDISASQYGVTLFQDLPRAIAEMTRVTKPGGRVALTVYGPPHHVESLGFFLGAMRAVVPGLAWTADDLPPAFHVMERHKLLSALAGAGLRNISVETVTQEILFESGKHLWDQVTNRSPVATGSVAGLTSEQATLVQEVLDGMLRERAAEKGAAALTDANHVGIGTK